MWSRRKWRFTAARKWEVSCDVIKNRQLPVGYFAKRKLNVVCVTCLSALLALCLQHGKTGRLRVRDKEPSLPQGKESDKWHETLVPRRIPEAVGTMPANYCTDPCHPMRCGHDLSSFLRFKKCCVLGSQKKCDCVCVCVIVCVCLCARAC